MSKLPQPKPHFLAISPYIGGEAKAEGGQRLIRLASNESAIGPSPRAMQAFVEMAGQIHRYPDGASQYLRDALAEKHGLPAEQIICSNGSDAMLTMLARCFAGVGDEVIHTAHGFLMFPLAAKAAGATPVSVAENNCLASVDNILAAITPRTTMIFLANPNNPTGTYLPFSEIERLQASLPANILLVLDGAYSEFMADVADYNNGRALVDKGNVVLVNTFSKIFAMAALRLGWAYCPPHVADALNRAREPFNVNAAAQIAGVAALQDEAHIKAALAQNKTVLQQTSAGLKKLGLAFHPSHANFLLVDFGHFGAENVRLQLKNQGILVRQMGAYGLAQYLRISMGTEEEMTIVLENLARL